MFLSIILCLFSLFPGSSQIITKTVHTKHYTALIGITVIDGEGNPPLKNRVILIDGSTIRDIDSAVGYNYPKGTRKINLQGKYIIPGLIDTHSHVTVLALTDSGRLSERVDREASIDFLKTMLAYGITTIRNPAAPTIDGVQLREAVKSGKLTGPDIYTSGHALNRTNENFGPFVAVRTTAQVKKEIRKQAKAGVDCIKVYAGLKPHLVKAAIDEAHKHNLKVIGHLQNTSWTKAAEMGIDAISHAGPWHASYLPLALRANYRPTFIGRLFWLENTDFNGKAIQKMIEVIKRKNISIEPTLIAFHTKFWGDDPRHTKNPGLSLVHPTILNVWSKTTFVKDRTAEDFKRAKAQWPKLLSLTRMLYQKGALITAGSDFPNPWVLPGLGLHAELELLHSAGIPPLEVIKIATWNGALSLGIHKITGSIKKGKHADLVVLNKNPLADIKNTRQVHLIFKRGKKYLPGALYKNYKKD